MTVRTRLALSICAIMLLLVLPALYGVSRLARLRGIAEDLHVRQAAALLALGRLQTSLAELDRYERSYIATGGPDLRAGVQGSLHDARVQLARLSQRYAEAVQPTRVALDSLERAARIVQGYIESGQAQAATNLYEQVKPLIPALQRSLDATARSIDARSQQDLIAAQRISGAATTTTLGGVALALVIALLLGIWTTGAYTTPLRQLRRATAAVAGGELVVPPHLPYGRSDEIGDLSRSFRAMTQRLAELDRLKAEFISIATHELKTPINVIGGYAELLSDGVYGDVPERQQEVLAAVQEQTQVLTRLVNQLLDMSRLEAGGLQMELEPVDLRGLVGSVERAFTALARQKGIDFSVALDEATPRTMMLDAERVRDQLLGNLLSNAFKFTGEGGRIRLAAAPEDGMLHISVADTGIGIPEDQQAHIFDRYYQVGSEARAKGAGLGLSIAKEIVEAHGGRIYVESRPHDGSTFHIQLPIERGDATLQRAVRAAHG